MVPRDIQHQNHTVVNSANEYATAHAVGYGDIVCMVGVKHLKGNFSGAFDCEDIDVRILPGCPSVNEAIDIKTYVPLRSGDRASAFEYIYEHGEFNLKILRYTFVANAVVIPANLIIPVSYTHLTLPTSDLV